MVRGVASVMAMIAAMVMAVLDNQTYSILQKPLLQIHFAAHAFYLAALSLLVHAFVL